MTQRTPIKVSAAHARLLFQGCTETYIRTVCYGRCCESPRDAVGYRVGVVPWEEGPLRELGAVVGGGRLVGPNPETMRCPFKGDDGLCTIHTSGHKPLTCRISPFVINRNNTLITKNRNRCMTCYRDKTVAKTPAYIAYRASLEALFGKPEADRIVRKLDDGAGDFMANMSEDMYRDYMTTVHHYTPVPRKSQKYKP